MVQSVYKFLNKAGKVIYIGKTKNLKQRMQFHFSAQGHLKETVYKQVNKIEFTTFITEFEATIYELYLINMFEPKYNVKSVMDENRELETLGIGNNSVNKRILTRKWFEYPRGVRLNIEDKKRWYIELSEELEEWYDVQSFACYEDEFSDVEDMKSVLEMIEHSTKWNILHNLAKENGEECY